MHKLFTGLVVLCNLCRHVNRGTVSGKHKVQATNVANFDESSARSLQLLLHLDP